MGLPRGKSVLPIDPLKIKSPQNTKSSITKLRLPGECPGLKIIEKLKKGIPKKYVLPKIVVKNLISQYKAYLKNPLKKKELKKYQCSIHTYLNDSIQKLLQFLETDYLKSAKSEIGLYSEPYGKQGHTDTLRSFTLEDITALQVHEPILPVLVNRFDQPSPDIFKDVGSARIGVKAFQN